MTPSFKGQIQGVCHVNRVQIRARKLDETLYFRATVVIGSAQTSSYNCSRLIRVSFDFSIAAPIDTEYNVPEM